MSVNEKPSLELSRFHWRIARPVTDLDAMVRFYRDGLGFQIIGQFQDHDGFHGVMLGHPGAPHHLEFTQCDHHAPLALSPDQLLVIYLPDTGQWQTAIEQLCSQGHLPVPSFNPYWDQKGQTFVDPEGGRVVLQNASWPV